MSRTSSAIKGTRLPREWEPGELELQYLTSRRPLLDPQQRDDLTRDFVDYWLAEPDPHGRKVDWSRTFMAHCRRWKPWAENEIKPNRVYNRNAANDPYGDDVVV